MTALGEAVISGSAFGGRPATPASPLVALECSYENALGAMLSTLLTEFPGFMSTIRLVTDNREEAMTRLVHAEHKAPSFYLPARETLLDVLRGKLVVAKAIHDLKFLRDPTERKLASQIFAASKKFLEGERPTPTVEASPMEAQLPNRKIIKISPVWVRHHRPQRLMLLYLWEDELTDLQLRVAAGLLHLAIETHSTKFRGRELDFISVARPAFSAGRKLRKYGWDQLNPFYGEELEKALKFYLCDLWEEYHKRGPRPVNEKRRDPDLLDY
jgi:hypothetical protein